MTPAQKRPIPARRHSLGRRDLFSRFAKQAARITGQPVAFFAAAGIVLLWAITGPVFGFSDTWQLVINTSTTIVTFMMVFLIQNTQNRDTMAVQLKLDELIRSHKGAHTALLNLEELSTAELDQFQRIYLEMAEKAREQLRKGGKDTDSPRISIDD